MTTIRGIFAPDRWLARLMGCDVYRFAVGAENLTTDDRGLRRELEKILLRPSFLYAKIDVRDLALAHYSESLGFRLIDTNVGLSKTCTETSDLSSPFEIRFAEPSDEEGVARVARDSFSCSRFHLDPCIPKKIADNIKSEWTRSFFRGQRGDHMVVALSGGALVGFQQILVRGEGLLVTDLIAVDVNYRRQGIAAAMCNFAEAKIPGARRARVGTQIANAPSIRLYEAMGFRVDRAQYVFHLHGPSD